MGRLSALGGAGGVRQCVAREGSGGPGRTVRGGGMTPGTRKRRPPRLSRSKTATVPGSTNDEGPACHLGKRARTRAKERTDLSDCRRLSEGRRTLERAVTQAA
ncbi:hypothetical protein GCM10010211_48730 [Streptomyces albospinus]|uniref:Uncharacterized protein n=1 Tax=Streptomyces albospinus TaxID=285515 RepID=A0ABQ2VD60_9ACTN|nr:hypothetical protein GCM10010211_48730 [Streptomyces albospinus]